MKINFAEKSDKKIIVNGETIGRDNDVACQRIRIQN